MANFATFSEFVDFCLSTSRGGPAVKRGAVEAVLHAARVARVRDDEHDVVVLVDDLRGHKI